MEPAAPSTTYYLAACSEANAGLKNRTPGYANPISGIPVSPMISADSLIVDLAVRVQFLTGETVCGVVFHITSSRNGLPQMEVSNENRTLPTKRSAVGSARRNDRTGARR